MPKFSEVWFRRLLNILIHRALSKIRPSEKTPIHHPISLMTTLQDAQRPQWYVLNHIGHFPYRDRARKSVDTFNRAEGTDLDLFAPTYVQREERDGQVQLRRVNLTFHYVFLHGSLPDIKRLCSLDNGFSFLLNRSGAERYATVDDRTMHDFRQIARAYENCLPFYRIDAVELEKGDLVEIVNGDFPGLIGTYLPRAKSNSGNIVLLVDDCFGVKLFDIKATDIRVLEFAPGTTRAYDQIDAFVPNLLAALRHYAAGEPLTPALATRLNVFLRRMEVVRLNNPKLEARLSILLYATAHILGLTDEATHYRDRYDNRAEAITNPWTRLLVNLILHTITGTPGNLPELPGDPATRAQQQLADILQEIGSCVMHS